jgi:hypothetical protein
MTELWDEMEVAPEVRASFAPCYFLEPLAEGPRESDGGAAPQPFDEARPSQRGALAEGRVVSFCRGTFVDDACVST